MIAWTYDSNNSICLGFELREVREWIWTVEDGFAVKKSPCWTVGKKQRSICCGKPSEGNILCGDDEPTFSARCEKAVERHNFDEL